MSFRISGLSAAPYLALYGQSDQALGALGVRRYVADACPGYPDRIELRDVSPGECVLLVNYAHQPADTPYRASHAIFVREGAADAYDRVDEVPDVLRVRPLSLRAFDAQHWMTDALLVPGDELGAGVERLFADPAVAYLQAHYATRGGYAARITRV